DLVLLLRDRPAGGVLRCEARLVDLRPVLAGVLRPAAAGRALTDHDALVIVLILRERRDRRPAERLIDALCRVEAVAGALLRHGRRLRDVLRLRRRIAGRVVLEDVGAVVGAVLRDDAGLHDVRRAALLDAARVFPTDLTGLL